MGRSENRGGGRRGGFLLGALVGAIIGVLLAPRSGKETRAQLLGGSNPLSGQVDRVRGALEAGIDQAADQSEALRRKIEETRERLRRQMAADESSAEDGAGETSDERPNVI